MVEPGAAPNGGPAPPIGNPGVTEGPPSVSSFVDMAARSIVTPLSSNKNMKTIGIMHMLLVQDMDRAISFYEKTFGFKVLQKSGFWMRFFMSFF